MEKRKSFCGAREAWWVNGMMHVCATGVRDPKYDPRPAVDPLVLYLWSLPFSYSKWDNLKSVFFMATGK